MLCIGNSPQMQETYSPVISLICTVALKMMNQDGKHHSMLLLDEAPTLYIPKLEAVPATGRERKIAVFYIAQDISQIVDRYGKEKKDTIIANLANQFWGRVSHHETAEHISRIFGKHEVYRESRTYAGQHVSRTESLVDKEVLKASEVYNFTPGTFAYVIVDWRGRNIKGVKKFYYENNILTYGNDPIILTDKEIDVTKTYNELKREVREILDKNIVEENKKVEHKNKNNSNELF
jgi:type IV secretory pathway TraG/TraD family ATPase VirD4